LLFYVQISGNGLCHSIL